MGEERHRIVVGVDYGTTYSGVAFLPLRGGEADYTEIEIISTWPGRGGDMDSKRHDKAPTEISYENNRNLWGYQIPAGASRYGCFKLLLDAKTGKTRFDDPNLNSVIDAGNPNAVLALPPGKDVHEVTFEYLKFLYEHIMEQLQKRFALSFESTPIQFVLTTPAIWSHEAQNATLAAAKRAGFSSRVGDTIIMVAEPEAAASYCLRDMDEGSGKDLKEGERILICDAGGGTVDLVTYTISQTSPCLRVREANVGSGGKCGSTAIDRAFLKWLEPRVGRAFNRWSPKKTGRGSSLMMIFELAKRSFGTSSYEQVWRIPLGNVEDDEENGIEDGEIKITDKDMAEIFDPVVDMVIQLVDEQISGANNQGHQDEPLSVILVGGFGESQYLYTRLKDWCESQSFPVNLIHPRHSWSAVARGAVIHGVESIQKIRSAPEVEAIPTTGGLVDSRKLKRHYGVFLSTLFDPEVHDEETIYFDPLTMQVMTSDNVEWFAEKGKDAENGQHFPIPCFSRFPEWMSRSFTLDLAGSDLEDAPSSAKRGKVETIGKVPANLSSLPDSAFHVVAITPRGRVFAAEITVDMSVGSADIKFDVMFKGKSYGSYSLEN